MNTEEVKQPEHTCPCELWMLHIREGGRGKAVILNKEQEALLNPDYHLANRKLKRYKITKDFLLQGICGLDEEAEFNIERDFGKIAGFFRCRIYIYDEDSKTMTVLEPANYDSGQDKHISSFVGVLRNGVLHRITDKKERLSHINKHLSLLRWSKKKIEKN